MFAAVFRSEPPAETLSGFQDADRVAVQPAADFLSGFRFPALYSAGLPKFSGAVFEKLELFKLENRQENLRDRLAGDFRKTAGEVANYFSGIVCEKHSPGNNFRAAASELFFAKGQQNR